METVGTGARWPLTGVDEAVEAVIASLDGVDVAGVVLGGQAGVGKTSLARSVGARLGERGDTVVTVVATPTTTDVPLGALGSLVAHLGEMVDGSGVRAEVERTILARRGAGRLVVVVDDTPLLDAGSAEVLFDLARRRLVAVVATARDGHRLPPQLDGLLVEGAVVRHTVRPLDAASLAAAAGTFLGGTLDGEAARLVWEASQGVPLHARELVQANLDAGHLTRGTDGWAFTRPPLTPPTLLALVSSRFVGLDAEDRHRFEALALAQPLPLDAATELAGVDLLAALEEGGLAVVASGLGGLEVRLGHPLYDEAVRAQLGPLQQRRAALRAVEAIEGIVPRTPDLHLRAVCLRAEHALPVAPSDAVDAARRALTLMDPVLAETLVGLADTSFDARFVLGVSLSTQGRVDEADTAFAEAVAAAGDDAQRARVISRRANNIGTVGGRFAESLQILEDGLDALTDPHWRSFIAADVSYLRLWTGTVGANGNTTTADEATPGAVRANECLAGAVVAVMLGDLAEAEALVAEGMPLLPTILDDVPMARDLLTLSMFLAKAFAGDTVAAADIVRAELERCAARGAATPGPWLAVRAMQRLHDGAALDAVSDSFEAERHLRDVDTAGLLPLVQAVRATALAQLGRGEDSVAAAEAVSDQWLDEPKVKMHLAVAEAWREVGANGATRAHAAAVRLAAAGQDALDANHVPFAGLAAYDGVRMGQPAVVLPVLRAATARWEGPLAEALLAHGEALASGDPAGLLEVADRLVAMGCRLPGAEAAAQASALFERGGHDADARRAEYTAATLAAPLGDDVRSISLGTPRGLTAREREIATLAASGRRSKEVAELLEISTRTVDNHLAAIYRKLGVANRAELAARLR
ncbi:MAG: LuxR C-terminal-related transcriptional regulator [Acidimicrobiales bacterium]